MKIPLILSTACFCLLTTLVTAMPIFKDGKEQAIIVIPDQAPAITQEAAREMVRYLNKATGGAFSMKPESELLPVDGPNRIYVGLAAEGEKNGLKADLLKKNHYITFAAPKALYLYGRDDVTALPYVDDVAEMGSLLAVYDWLDRELGVRWLWPGEAGTVVPRHERVETKEAPPRYGKPFLMHADLRFYMRYYVPGKPNRYGRGEGLNDKSFEVGSQWLRRHKVVRTSGGDRFYGHGFGDYWKRFGESNPEFFALRKDGKRGPIDQRVTLTQLCVSNPNLHKQIVKDWLETRTPERPWINGCENDRRAIDPFCECVDCKAWDVPEAKVSVQRNPWHIDSRDPEGVDPYETVSKTDRYAKFLLALLAEGKRHDPSAKVVGYAYSHYSDAPVQTKLNEDILIIHVPPYVYPLDKEAEGKGRQLWDEWRATGAQMIYRPNDFLIGHPVPWIYPTQFGRDFKHFLDNGMMAVDFDTLTGLWGTQGINNYLLGRLISRPDLTPEAVLDEYVGAFGPAGDTIREYLGFWERITAECDFAFHDEINGGWAVAMRGAHRIFTPERFSEGLVILNRAEDAAANEEMPGRRVRYLKVWLEHSRLTTETIALYRSFDPANPTRKERAAFSQQLLKLKGFREENRRYLEGANWLFIERWEPWRLWKLE